MNSQAAILFICNKIRNLAEGLDRVHKSIFLLETYSDDKEIEIKNLSNPIAIAARILGYEDVKIIQQSKRQTRYEIDERALSKHKIIMKQFQIPNLSSNQNIKTMQRVIDKQLVRVVIIPFSVSLLDKNNEIKKRATRRQDLDNQLYEEIKKLSGGVQLEKARLKQISMLKEFDHEAEEKENVIHDRMYLAENIIEMLINTTDLYVPVMLIESDKKLESRIQERIKEVKDYFNCPEVQPRLFVHSASEELDSNNKSVVGYFIDKRDEVNYVDKGIWNEKHYSEDKYFRTNLYKIRNIKINIPFSKRSKQVTDMRNSITSKSISCIGSVFYFIYKKLGLDAEIGKKGVVLAGTNVGIEKENDILLVSKFKAIEEEFDYTNTVFLRNSHRKKNDFSFDAVLKQFYTKERLQQQWGIEVDTTKDIIPNNILMLEILHDFQQANDKFLAQFELRPTEGCQQEKTCFILEHIKLVCELILGLNAVDLNDEPHGNFACANLQVYMNFIVSLFEDVARNRRTTGMSSTIFDLSKKLFSRLTIRKETIIDLIIQQQDSFRPNEPSHYYSLLLRIIDFNKGEDPSWTAYAESVLLKYRGFVLADQSPYGCAKLVQSAKSLYKLLVYKKVQSKTYKIVSKIDVYKKLGDVLMTLGEPRLAFIFYQKNDMVYQMRQCAKEFLKYAVPSERIGMLLDLAHEFLSINRIEFARKLFQRAYSLAFNGMNSLDLARLCKKNEVACNKVQECLNSAYSRKVSLFVGTVRETIGKDIKGDIEAFAEGKFPEGLTEEIESMWWDETEDTCQRAHRLY